MPKVAQDLLTEFGAAVERARVLKGWELNDVANRVAEMERGKPGQKATPPARSFLSDIEKGKRSISPVTVGKLIKALDLPESWIDRFRNAKIAPEAEETPQDREAERLMRMVESDPTAPATAERLLIDLAESISGHRLIDPMAAYASLKSALEAADNIKARGELPQNHDDQLQAVLREVSRLNDLGLRDEAAAALDEALQRTDAARDAIFTLQIDQDRIRDDADAATNRLFVQLKAANPPDGLFNAIRKMAAEWYERGHRKGLRFDLEVALALGRLSSPHAKGGEIAAARNDIAQTLIALSKSERGLDKNHEAILLFKSVSNFFFGRYNFLQWAGVQNNLGYAYRELSNRSGDMNNLELAIEAFENAGKIWTRASHTKLYATVVMNLASALRRLGELSQNRLFVDRALALIQESAELRPIVASTEDFAFSQNSLGNILLSLNDYGADPETLNRAKKAFGAALLVWNRDKDPLNWAMVKNNLGLAHHALGECTRNADDYSEALFAFDDSLHVRSEEKTPFDWARTKLNIATSAFALFQINSAEARLGEAGSNAQAARAVFLRIRNQHEIARCDTLLARIAALEAGGTSPPSR